MRSRLRYFVQPTYQPALTEKSGSAQLQKQKISSREERAAAYRSAQELREKLQSQVTQLLSSKYFNA